MGGAGRWVKPQPCKFVMSVIKAAFPVSRCVYTSREKKCQSAREPQLLISPARRCRVDVGLSEYKLRASSVLVRFLLCLLALMGRCDAPEYYYREERRDRRDKGEYSSAAFYPLRLRWAEHVARVGEFRNAYRVLDGRPERKRPLGRQRRRWEDNIKMDLREVVYDDRDWINLAQDRVRWRAYVSATGIACSAEVDLELRSGVTSIPAWADNLVP
ncbi:hypothetical protein ANN_09616 [Periplaneta americana]|uniref:Uncharacterized protein n=1 Tax=Periplaneta americana TaxID=6978 RepID=A0ABQ8TLS6_PERAM|nr:hypothetical protein ANN_09616 [Periplaneta americana]